MYVIYINVFFKYSKLVFIFNIILQYHITVSLIKLKKCILIFTRIQNTGKMWYVLVQFFATHTAGGNWIFWNEKRTYNKNGNIFKDSIAMESNL